MASIDEKLKRMPRTIRVGSLAGGLSEFLSIQAAINYCCAQTGVWVIEIYPGTYLEGDITPPNGAADITLRGVGVGRVIIAPVAIPAAAVIVSGFTLTLDNLTVDAPDNTRPALRVTGGLCHAAETTLVGVGVGDTIQQVAGSIVLDGCRVLSGDIDLSTAQCALAINFSLLEGPIDTAAQALAHQITASHTDFGNQNINSAATGATTVVLENCTYVGTITNAGTGAFTIRNSDSNTVSVTNAAGAITCYGGTILNWGGTTGTILWYETTGLMKVLPRVALDNININAALNALPAQGGRVILLGGQYMLAAPVIFPMNNIILEGEGWSTFLNGNNLLTTNHAIQISARSNCCVKNLSIRTQAGGGKTCHCIFIEDGANDFLIENVYIEDSDSDGIHIEGTSITRGKIFNCFIEGADNHGIHITPDGGDITQHFHIWKNHIQSADIDGIHFTTCAGHRYHIIEGNTIQSCVGSGIVAAEWVMECQIIDNYLRANTVSGIVLSANDDNNLIENNYCNANGAYGIDIAAATCSENRVKNNKLIGNTTAAIRDLGTLTQLPYIFIPVPNPSTNIGTHPAEQLTDGLEVVSRFNLYIPIEFQELVTAHVIVVPGGTGNMRRSVATNWGEAGSGETYNAATDAIAAGEVAVTTDWLELIDIAAAFNGPPPIAPGDMVGVAFTRHGNHVNDTVGANCYLLGVRVQYV